MNNQEKHAKFKQLQQQLKQIAKELKQAETEDLFIPKCQQIGFKEGYFKVSTMIDYIADMME